MNKRIKDAIELTTKVLLAAKNDNKIVACSVSGGADSDILVDLCERTVPHFVNYVFFDTMIEYQATKEHLKYLEQKYGIEIHREKAKVPVPLGNKKYGVPFLSKQVSEFIYRLQKHNFTWEDKPYEELIQKYPNCQIALKWWCNARSEDSWFNIKRNTWLKEFMIKNPPPFKVSSKCCDGAKKRPADNYYKTHQVDISIIGIRKAEGGARAVHKDQLEYSKSHKMQMFYPILFFTDSDRSEYETEFSIAHSKCYSEYGMVRTGCAACPLGQDFTLKRKILREYEPKLSKAIENMWGEVYEYTNKYHEFQKMMNRKYKEKKKCVCGCTEFTGDDVAMNLKYFGRDVKTLLCRGCFQNIMEMTDEQWDEAIEDFKAQGCELF